MSSHSEALPFSQQMRLHLGQNLFVLASSQILGGVLSAAVVMAATRLVGPAGYGSYSLFLMSAAVGGALGISWLFNGIYKVMADQRAAGQHLGATLGTGLMFVALIWLLLSTLLALNASWLQSYIGLGTLGTVLLSAYVLVSSLVTIANYTFQAMGDFKRYAVLPNIERLLFLVLLLAAIRFQVKMSATGLAGALVFSQIVLLTLAGVQMNWSRIGHLQWSWPSLRFMVAFAAPYILTNALIAGAQWWDVTVIERHLSRSHLGVFYLAVQFQTLSTQIIAIANTLLVQMFIALRNEHRHEEIRTFYLNHAPRLILAATALLLLGSVVLQVLFPYIFRREFAGALPLMQWLVLPLHASTVFVLFHPLLFARGNTRVITLITLVAFLFTAPLTYWLVPHLGPSGALIGRCASGLVNTGLAVILARGFEFQKPWPVVGAFAAGQAALALNAWWLT